MPSKLQPDKPRFTTIKLYNHPAGHLSFWYPPEWQLLETDSPHVAVTLFPDAADPAASIMIEVKEFPGPVEATDHDIIVGGVREGLEQLTDHRLEGWRELGSLDEEEIQTASWGLEWLCTFVDDGQRRKRRARLFFTDQHSYSVICQGSTEDVYAYWQGMFEYVLLTVGVNQFSTVEWAEQQNWEKA